MKKLILYFTLATFNLYADVSLKHLIDYEKSICLERLETASVAELWDAFLEGQTQLFYEPESNWIEKQSCWQEVQNILEIGSGNGAYLSKLANEYPEKSFLGIEKLPHSVKLAQDHFERNGVIFQEGDAEVFNEQLTGCADLILFRLTLQHLKNPLLALENAWKYLSSNGYVLIIDSCDQAKKTSHPLAEIDKTLEAVAETQVNKKSGNRKISLEILQMLENQQQPLSQLFEIVSSNLDSSGNPLSEAFRLEGIENRKLSFNHSLLFMTLLHRTYGISMDKSKSYDEVKSYLENENAWTVLGMHYLLLKKK